MNDTNGKEKKILKLNCGCETFEGEKDTCTNLNIPFPFVQVPGSTPHRPLNPTLVLQFCKKCKSPLKSWWEIPKATTIHLA